jgi:hypothetical protein
MGALRENEDSCGRYRHRHARFNGRNGASASCPQAVARLPHRCNSGRHRPDTESLPNDAKFLTKPVGDKELFNALEQLGDRMIAARRLSGSRIGNSIRFETPSECPLGAVFPAHKVALTANGIVSRRRSKSLGRTRSGPTALVDCGDAGGSVSYQWLPSGVLVELVIGGDRLAI